MKMTPQLCTQSLVEASTNTLHAGELGRLLDLQVVTRETLINLCLCVCVLVPDIFQREEGDRLNLSH